MRSFPFGDSKLVSSVTSGDPEDPPPSDPCCHSDVQQEAELLRVQQTEGDGGGGEHAQIKEILSRCYTCWSFVYNKLHRLL